VTPLRLVSAGVSAVAVAYGLARYGYGLLLPDIRSELGLSTELLGLIGTLSYVAYLLATAAVTAFAAQTGPRLPVVLGGAFGVVGMVSISLSEGATALAAGVLVAGASSAFAFPPFADAVGRCLLPEHRGRALSAISSGTGWGVLVSGPLALLVGGSWRTAWLAFAALGMIATLWAAWVLPARPLGGGERAPARLHLSWFACPRSAPLLVGALLVGLGSSVYWTFAVDYVVGYGALSASAGRLLLVLVGVASILGSFGGDLIELVGARRALWLGSSLLALSLALLAAAPGSWLAVGPSAVLFGAAYNVVVAIQAIWSARVFSGRPSAGLGAAMFMNGLGLMLGPLAGGVVAGQLGFPAAFVASAVVVSAVALLYPREELQAVAAS